MSYIKRNRREKDPEEGLERDVCMDGWNKKIFRNNVSDRL